MKGVYYNEFDPYAAQWLRNLMAEGVIPDGEVDERSITEVDPIDLVGRQRAHFFAGIGVWERALQLAGWPGDREVWTGSCPCQPFSAAGKRQGAADSRDLWPEFSRLIAARRPQVVFGEQVASADVLGAAGGQRRGDGQRVWIDRVRADLEASGYTVGACVLGAHSVGSPHIRQRLFWVAHTGQVERGPAGEHRPDRESAPDRGEETVDYQRRGDAVGMGFAPRVGDRPDADTGSIGAGEAEGRECGRGGSSSSAAGVGMGESSGKRPQRVVRTWAAAGAVVGADGGFWADSRIIRCRDGKARRIPLEPSLFPLADGTAGRVVVVRPGEQAGAPVQGQEATRKVNRAGALRGAGNAIVPQAAALFVRAFLETEYADHP